MSKILTLLGFASKSRNLTFGMDMTVTAVKSGKAKLVLLSGEISPKSLKEISFFTDKKNIPVIVLSEIDIETLSQAVGKKCGITGILDRSFAEAIVKAYQEER